MDYVLVFLSGFFTDLFYALYINYLEKNRKLAAANTSILIGLCSVIFVLEIQKSNVYIVLWLTGLWLGTYVSQLITQHNETRKRIFMRGFRCKKSSRKITE